MAGLNPINADWNRITAEQVRDAATDYTVARAKSVSDKVNTYVATLLTHLISLAFFSHWYTANVVANYAIGAAIASPVVKTPIQYVTQKVSDASIKSYVCGAAACEGVNPAYRPSAFTLLSSCA